MSYLRILTAGYVSIYNLPVGGLPEEIRDLVKFVDQWISFIRLYAKGELYAKNEKYYNSKDILIKIFSNTKETFDLLIRKSGHKYFIKREIFEFIYEYSMPKIPYKEALLNYPHLVVNPRFIFKTICITESEKLFKHAISYFECDGVIHGLYLYVSNYCDKWVANIILSEVERSKILNYKFGRDNRPNEKDIEKNIWIQRSRTLYCFTQP